MLCADPDLMPNLHHSESVHNAESDWDAQASSEQSAPAYTMRQEGGATRIRAQLNVAAPAPIVWSAITDVGAYASVMPNVARCEPTQQQVAEGMLVHLKLFSQAPFWRLHAAAVVHMLPIEPLTAGQGHMLRFEMDSGDFAQLHGRWIVLPAGQAQDAGSVLRFEVFLTPKPRAQLPMRLARYLVDYTLPANIAALAQQAAQVRPYYTGAAGSCALCTTACNLCCTVVPNDAAL